MDYVSFLKRRFNQNRMTMLEVRERLFCSGEFSYYPSEKEVKDLFEKIK